MCSVRFKLWRRAEFFMWAKLESIPAAGIKSREQPGNTVIGRQRDRREEGKVRERWSPSMDFLRPRNLRRDYLFVGAINVAFATCERIYRSRAIAGFCSLTSLSARLSIYIRIYDIVYSQLFFSLFIYLSLIYLSTIRRDGRAFNIKKSVQ